jgi:pimeloyl-ACP methyl ester carboxylesterase
MYTTQSTNHPVVPSPVAERDPIEPSCTPHRAPRREPVWRVVGASVATGSVAAIVSTFVVFGGAEEHVITGSALLSFAAGWAMLVLLSVRFTAQPQRWAWVPAAAMAIAGASLLVLRPGDGALDRAGWAWSPVALGMAVWVFTHVRRGFVGRVRWLLYPVTALLAVAAVGASCETTMRAHDRHTLAAPGARYDVGGHRLHLYCSGQGGPTVVLESGLGGSSAGWARVIPALNGTTRICAYDRAGQGWSDDVARPQDGVAIAADLHALLAAAGEAGPFVLVGHSAGGPYVMTYAAQYPDDIAGMVLLDAMSPEEFTALPGFAAEQSMMHRGLGLLPSLARLGIARVLPTSAWSNLPEPAASQVQAFSSSARGMRNMRDEQSMYRTVFAQARALVSMGDEPLVVVSATESLRKHAAWSSLQDRLGALSTDSRHRVADSSHAGLLGDAEGAAASVRAIADVVSSVRTGRPLAGD